MNKLTFSRTAWLQAITVLVLTALMAAAGGYVWMVHQRAETRIRDIEPRYARLLGLLEHGKDVQNQMAQSNAQLARIAYPASQDVTKAGNDAQERLRALFADSKLDIVSIQVLPAKDEGKFDRIPISLRVEGELAGIQNALTLLTAQTPTVQFDGLSMQTIGAVKPASTQRLGGQFSFFVLRMRS